MYNVRLAEPADFDAILPMARKFYSSTTFSELMEEDIPSMVEFYIHMLTNGFVLLAELDGEAVGFLGAVVQPFHLQLKCKVCAEAMWWVEPEHRGGSVGGMMVSRFDELAKVTGCKAKTLSMLDTTPEQVGDYYKSLGYRPIETAFIKEV